MSTGIAPASLEPFIAAQLAGTALGLVLVAAVFAHPSPAQTGTVAVQDEPELATPASS
ncbi:hypothetical protein O3S80_00365 [Streptomyces sp. Lzd4kr]|nr:hypothetical protein [Streptomyces sp. Lzd4kr]